LVTVAVVSFGVALAALSLYAGILVGSAITRKQHQQEIARLRGAVRTMRAELDSRRRGHPQNRKEEP